MPKTLKNLTGLRGLAALLVVLYHYSKLQTGFNARGTIGILSHGYMMVDLFFVLSGIVMAHVYGEKLRSGADLSKNYLNFLLARITRLWPVIAASILVAFIPYYAAIIQTTITAKWTTETVSLFHLDDALRGMLFLGGTEINGPLWSVITEFWTYPLLLPLLLVWKLPRAAMLALALITLSWPIWFGWLDINIAAFAGKDAFFRCVAGFSNGVIAYLIMGVFPSLRRHLAQRAVVASLALFILLSMSLYWPKELILMALALFVAVMPWTDEGSLISRCLESPAVVWLGGISFSLYAIHEPVKYIVMMSAGDHMTSPYARFALLLFCLAVAMTLADAVKRRVEIPGTAVMRRFLLPDTPAPTSLAG